MSRAILLGPLAPQTDLLSIAGELRVDGPVALITAGWEEGERNDAEIDRRLGGGTRNLGLYGRLLDVLETDSEYAEAEQRMRQQLAEAEALYTIRVTHGLAAVNAVLRRYSAARRSAGTELDQAIHAVKALDDGFLQTVHDAHAALSDAFPPEQRDIIATHRAAVAAILQECEVLAIAGGHVRVVATCLALFDIGSAVARMPVIAWSSGAAALAEAVVVLDDHDIAARPAIVVEEGMGVVRTLIPLSDAEHRLTVGDQESLATVSRRFAPRACALLDTGDRIDVVDSEPVLAMARVVAPDGSIRTPEAAA